jgi:CRISPR/Cas system-associated exonuclease Cas4 (RecB family)
MSCNYCPYSPSKIGLYNQCPAKFKFKYIDEIEVKSESEHLTKGKILHTLLEIRDMSLKEQVEVLKKEYKDDPFFTINMVKECFKIYNDFKKSDIYNEIFSRKILAVELGAGLDKQLNKCDFFNDDALFRGKIDLVTVDEATDIVYITDWKSGKDKSDGLYKQTPDQLMYYATYYFQTFPVDKIVLEYVFIEHNTKTTFEMTRCNLDKYKKFVLKSILNIERDNEFNPNVTGLCGTCEYADFCIPF